MIDLYKGKKGKSKSKSKYDKRNKSATFNKKKKKGRHGDSESDSDDDIETRRNRRNKKNAKNKKNKGKGKNYLKRNMSSITTNKRKNFNSSRRNYSATSLRRKNNLRSGKDRKNRFLGSSTSRRNRSAQKFGHNRLTSAGKDSRNRTFSSNFTQVPKTDRKGGKKFGMNNTMTSYHRNSLKNIMSIYRMNTNTFNNDIDKKTINTYQQNGKGLFNTNMNDFYNKDGLKHRFGSKIDKDEQKKLDLERNYHSRVVTNPKELELLYQRDILRGTELNPYSTNWPAHYLKLGYNSGFYYDDYQDGVPILRLKKLRRNLLPPIDKSRLSQSSQLSNDLFTSNFNYLTREDKINYILNTEQRDNQNNPFTSLDTRKKLLEKFRLVNTDEYKNTIQIINRREKEKEKEKVKEKEKEVKLDGDDDDSGEDGEDDDDDDDNDDDKDDDEEKEGDDEE